MTTPILQARPTRVNSRNSSAGFTRPLAVLLLLAVLAVTALFSLRLFRSQPPGPPPSPAARTPEPASLPVSRLSEATLRVLRQLKSPVEVRFYALLGEDQATTATRAFAQIVSELLADFQKAGQGRLLVTHIEARSPAADAAARADGIAPLPRSAKGTNFLGLALRCGEQKAVISRLAPEWAEALEFDLSRAIQQISSGLAGGQVLVNPTPESFAARDELRQALPELDSLSLEEARQQLRTTGLEEYKQAVAGFQIQLQEAQQRLALAQKESPAETEAARRDLQSLQDRQVEQLRVISQRMQERLAALEQIKAGRL